MNNEKLMEYILKSKISKLEESLGFNLNVSVVADAAGNNDEVENVYQLIADKGLESEIHRELADEINRVLKGDTFGITKEVEVDGEEVEITITGEVNYVSANR
mgnify:CR=1 FL=1